VSRAAEVMRHTWAYRLWQAPFARAKLRPLLRHTDIGRVRRVLDVACGPGTNTAAFAHADYLGIDINPAYVEYARRRYGRRFLTADLLDYRAEAEGRFDLVLVNSFLHHVDTPGAQRILQHLRGLIEPGGHVHVLDLVMPATPGPARFLARHDRGAFPRPLAEWRRLFSDAFEPVVFEDYRLSLAGVTLWHMVYFKGAPR
jgi:SAM-dependent methyltransferase